MKVEKDILDEDFDGDLDAELEDIEMPEISALYLGEMIDEAEQQKLEIYACTEITLNLVEDKFILTGKKLDVGGDDLGLMEPIEFATLADVKDYLKTKKLHDCQIDLNELRL